MAATSTRCGTATRSKPRDPVDRAFTHTTYLALVCDCAALQPLLPQVILARYTQNVSLPATLQALYRSCGFPFEFWNGSAGRVTSAIFRKWATRVRQAIGSFNPGAWIVLILDCATSHLDRASIGHLRRLGILVVIVPAKMTWLLQILDVYAFGKIKRELRQAEARARISSPTGQITPGTLMKLATTVIRRELINCDWSRFFGRLGAGETCSDLSSPVADLLAGTDVVPALPTRAEFALLINRPADSDVTRSLHASIIGQTLALQRSSPDARPPHSATYNLPVARDSSAPQSRRRTFEGMDADALLDLFANDQLEDPAYLHLFQDARSVQLDLAPGADV